jgi:hypothetical protein
VKRETILRIVESVAPPLGHQTVFLAARYIRCAMRLQVWFALSLIMAMASIVSVFVFIPIVSMYAFWMLIGAYIILASSLKHWF